MVSFINGNHTRGGELLGQEHQVHLVQGYVSKRIITKDVGELSRWFMVKNTPGRKRFRNCICIFSQRLVTDFPQILYYSTY